MIYILGKGSGLKMFYNDKYLTEQEKQNAFVVETLPEKENKEGYYGYLVLDNGNLYWEYVNIEKETPQE